MPRENKSRTGPGKYSHSEPGYIADLPLGTRGVAGIMADRISEERRSYNMSRIKSSNTSVELAVRRLVHGMGYRYRLHDKGLPGKPDIVFRPRRKVIFVHGCFWHQHSPSVCSDSRVPKSNLGYWEPKLERTKQRDAKNENLLVEMGWESLIVWECELRDIPALRSRIQGFLG